jgi:cobalt-zinc-cadmium efflux system outer membrane protein
MNMLRKIILVSISFLFTSFFRTSAAENSFPDTVARTLIDEEKLFLENSFQLLAAKFQINAADAAVIQARLYPNPNLFIDQGAYNHETNKWFDMSESGQTAASLTQQIILAGKRNKQITIAALNSKITTCQFYDLIRTLRYELHISFYELYYLMQTIPVYDREIESLGSLTNAYQTEYEKGNIAFKELARLLALQFNLENERTDIFREISEKEYNIILLTSDSLSHPVKPVVDTTKLNEYKPAEINLTQLIDSGFAQRYDLQIASTQMQISETNFSLQKSLRVPDLMLGANWDRNGSYITNYNSLSLAVDLPFWNRNKGNIKAAQSRISESAELKSQVELQVRNDISKAYSQLLQSDKLYHSSMQKFNGDFDRLLDGILTAYKNRTISLLEFIDYYETYKNSKIEFNRLQKNRITAIEDLNFATGSYIFK